jgi:hypothetical protein
LLKSSIELDAISFICPPPSYQFILWSNVHYEHVVATNCQISNCNEVATYDIELLCSCFHCICVFLLIILGFFELLLLMGFMVYGKCCLKAN